jgi:hypothetical protein
MQSLPRRSAERIMPKRSTPSQPRRFAEVSVWAKRHSRKEEEADEDRRDRTGAKVGGLHPSFVSMEVMGIPGV